jgi:tetrahydromethanopterin S-methyltransferase subunit D
MFSIPALGSVFILLMLIYFMMAVLANFQFNNIIEGEVIDPEFKNFRDG